MARRGAARVLAVRRNLDQKPVGGVEIFGTVFGAVPNDGVPHFLPQPASVPPLAMLPLYWLRIRSVLVEWQQDDQSVPPPLTLSVKINGAAGVAANMLDNITLQPLAIGTPAARLNTYTLVAPGASVAVFCRNTGVINPQYVSVMLWGWAYPQTLPDGAGYGA